MVVFKGDDWPNDHEKVLKLCGDFGNELIHIRKMLGCAGFKNNPIVKEDVYSMVYDLLIDYQILQRKFEEIRKIVSHPRINSGLAKVSPAD